MRYLMCCIYLFISSIFSYPALGQDGPIYPRPAYLYNWSDIVSEDQIFVVKFNLPVSEASVLSSSYCNVQGLGESVPTRVINGSTRNEILKSLYVSDDDLDSENIHLLQCQRLLPENAQLELIFGSGITSLASDDLAAIASKTAYKYDFKVRDKFKLDFSCTRANANAPCSPLSPVYLNFSSPIEQKYLSEIKLVNDGQQIKADIGDDANNGLVDRLVFSGPFTEKTDFEVVIPDNLQDDMGRKLSNHDSFPLSFFIGELPPLLKFVSGDFGIIERFANSAPGQKPDITVPVALRRVGPDLLTQELKISAGKVSDHVLTNSVDAITWLSKLQRLQSRSLSAGQFADVLAARPLRDRSESDLIIDVRSKSVFGSSDDLSKLDLPGLDDISSPEIELLGIPIAEPGLHIIEIASPELGKSLLDDDNNMYVRTAVLVTNLAVHIKTGRDDILAWVTSLDDGKPVANADIQVLDCTGELLLTGKTDANGIWHEKQYFDNYQYCDETGMSGLFVTARIDANHPLAFGQDDFSFAWSNWDRGIEPWRFNIPYSRDSEPDLVAHAVMDRTLLHTGETVSFKLFIRELNRSGLSNPDAKILPKFININHAGSGEEFKIPVNWENNSGGGLFALAKFDIADTAKLGEYSINVPLPGEDWQPSLYAGSFRVESFKLPLLTGSIKILPDDILIAPEKVQVDMQLSWISGGVAADIDTQLSAVSRPTEPYFNDYPDYSFYLPESLLDKNQKTDSIRRLILDKQVAKLGQDGAAILDIKELPETNNPQNWLFEMSFKDPNGQIQTIAQTKEVWPASLLVGIHTDLWFNRGEQANIKLLVLDTEAKPVANINVQLDGRQSTTYSTRKRLVGGFYAYDSHQQVASLGTLCSGETNSEGILECSVKIEQNGDIQLIAKVQDEQGRLARAGKSVWVWGDDAWFGSENNDRIDIIPNKSSYQPGEIAELTVRTPFANAQALVAIEREGVLATEVHNISSSDPVIKIPIQADWSPNVFVSVLAVRGRLRSVPWSSFFDWGWQSPKAWLNARDTQVQDAPQPSSLVDLAKPAYRFGIAKLNISDEADRLQVKVKTDKDSYQVKQTISADVQVNLPDGQPAAGASVAFAVVDEALLELFDNNSWDILQAMRQTRSYGVATSTAQAEVIGRRHYGRKAIPAGGGGGKVATRELFDTLLLWRGNVLLDEDGHANIEVPINDAITKFRLVAVADYKQNKFGTGMTSVISTQDLQLISGLSTVIREGDEYLAELSVRNRSSEDLDINITGRYEYPEGEYKDLPSKDIQLKSGKSLSLTWSIKAPELDQDNDVETINWWFTAQGSNKDGLLADDSINAQHTSDAIAVHQKLLPKIPVQVYQAELLHLQPLKSYELSMSVPDHAVFGANDIARGGVDILLQSKLVGALPGVYDWFKSYPYTCIEQQSAKYISMQDLSKWQQLMRELPRYQTENGLLSFFPESSGSVVLTAQILEISSYAKQLGWQFELPRRAQESMLTALQDYVYGRIEDDSWPNLHGDFWAKLIAINAIIKFDAWQDGMLDSLYFETGDWPTPALVTWLSVLQDVPEFSDKQMLLNRLNQTLRTRLLKRGTTMTLADESIEFGWWFMSNQATVQARFLLAVMESDYWQNDLPLIFNGLLKLQVNGHWETTSANVLAVLAVNTYSQSSGEAIGTLGVSSNGTAIADFDWQIIDEKGQQNIELPWPEAGDLDIQLQQGEGSGWATVMSKAAIDYQYLKSSGVIIERKIEALTKANPDYWSVGDIYKISLNINSDTDIFWAALSDPIPAGASILGTGLGRDSTIYDDVAENYWDYPSYVERDADMFRAYYEYLSKGEHNIEYTVRINTVGTFNMPPTRVQALYQPDVYGVLANKLIVVK